MIEFRNVCKSFADHRVIDGISFTVGTGEFFVLVGPSGGGKTTTLKMINRLVEPDSGQILIDGHDIASEDVRELRLGIGYVLQQIALFPNMTVGQNVTLIPELKHWPAAKRTARARELLGEVDLDPREYMNRMPSELGRRTAARGHHSRARRPAEGHAHGRAVQRARPDHAHAVAGADQTTPTAAGHHDRVRHA